MPFSRTLAAYLSLVALLFGNVAGWVHVGCSHHSLGCCASPLADCDFVAADKPAVDEHGGQCCCHHDCGIEVQAEVADSSPADSQPPADQHDSDSCSVCQSFFASRDAVALTDAALTIERLASTRNVVSVDDVFVENHHSPCHTVRGPPSV